jgi:hypothetical protein
MLLGVPMDRELPVQQLQRAAHPWLCAAVCGRRLSTYRASPERQNAFASVYAWNAFREGKAMLRAALSQGHQHSDSTNSLG